MITKHRHLFEDSVCLGFKTFTDASKEAEKREGEKLRDRRCQPAEMGGSGDVNSPGVRNSPWRKQEGSSVSSETLILPSPLCLPPLLGELSYYYQSV